MDKKLFALDIDDTQVADRHSGVSTAEDDVAANELKDYLCHLRERGHVVVHITNAVCEDFDLVVDRIAPADYLSCAASTQMYEIKDGHLSEIFDHSARLKNSGFDRDGICDILPNSNHLEILSGEHENDYKLSYRFTSTDAVVQADVVDYFIKRINESDFTARVEHVVAGGAAYIDILPINCSKGDNVKYLMERECILPENIFVFGNGGNDVSMLLSEFNCAVVGNSSDLLKDHVRQMLGKGRHIIADGARATGVIETLRKFELI